MHRERSPDKRIAWAAEPVNKHVVKRLRPIMQPSRYVSLERSIAFRRPHVNLPQIQDGAAVPAPQSTAQQVHPATQVVEAITAGELESATETTRKRARGEALQAATAVSMVRWPQHTDRWVPARWAHKGTDLNEL